MQTPIANYKDRNASVIIGVLVRRKQRSRSPGTTLKALEAMSVRRIKLMSGKAIFLRYTSVDDEIQLLNILLHKLNTTQDTTCITQVHVSCT